MYRTRCASYWAAALTVLALAAGAHAQGFQAVHSKDGTDVWAVGDAGVAYRSFDGGATWTTQNLGAKALHGVAAQGLTVIVVGDDGELRRSTDNGGNFALTVLPGSAHLRAIEMPDAAHAWTVGDGGTIFATTDSGTTWSAQTSGTSERLNAVRFRNATEGWAAGTAGTVLHTADGGSTWLPVNVGTTSATWRAVDTWDATVWLVGNDATAIVSTDGSTWSPVNLKIDSRSDVTGVWLTSPTTVLLTGGGGFVRTSSDGGVTWSFQKDPVLAETSDFYFMPGGATGWATHTKTRAIVRTVDAGATWTTTAAVTRSWALKQAVGSGSVRGNTIAQNGQNKNSVYAVMGIQVFKSLDRGETWSQISTISGGGSKTNAFYVAPSDSNLMVAAVGVVDRIMRSTNGGATWTQTLAIDFTEYGVPLEMDVNQPSDLYFGPEDGKLWYSHDFGATWNLRGNPGFRSPCDIQVVGDNSNVIWVADGVTGVGNGQMFRSTDGGVNFSLIYNGTGSEIPMISSPHLNPNLGFATHWSAGGVRRTTDMGATWTQTNTTGAAWGCDFAKDDPNFVIYGVYSGGTAYHSLDAGAAGTWITTPFSGTNYGFDAIDRATVIGLQAAGLYKMVNTYTTTTTSTQDITLLAPNGGEVWTAGDVYTIAWSATNVGLARVEYRPHAAAPWQLLAEVEGPAGAFAWTVPADTTTQAEVRVSDAWDAAPADGADATFTILAPVAVLTPASFHFGARGLGTTTLDSVQVSNTGTAALDGTVTVTGDGFALASPAALALGAGASSWMRVQFAPLSAIAYAGTLAVTGNFPTPAAVALAGQGLQVAALQLDAPDGGEVWQYNTTHDITWTSSAVQPLRIALQVSAGGAWSVLADSVPALPQHFTWTIPNAPTDTARIRLEEIGGSLADSSAAVFRIVVPSYAASADTVQLGTVTISTTGTATVLLTNAGTAPLSITAVSDDSPPFNAGRSTFVVPPSGSDSLGIYFHPTATGTQVAHFTLAADDPGAPHALVAVGTGVLPSDAGSLPATFALAHDGPNPFVKATTLRYRLPKRSPVRIEVFNLQGRRVATLVEATQPAGEYAVPFGSEVTAPAGRVGTLAAGVYFVQMQAGSFSKTYKLVLAR